MLYPALDQNSKSFSSKKKYGLSTAIKLGDIGFLQFKSIPITHLQFSLLLQWLLFKLQVTIFPIFLQLKANCEEIDSVWILKFMTFIVFLHLTSQNRSSLFQLIRKAYNWKQFTNISACYFLSIQLLSCIRHLKIRKLMSMYFVNN